MPDLFPHDHSQTETICGLTVSKRALAENAPGGPELPPDAPLWGVPVTETKVSPGWLRHALKDAADTRKRMGLESVLPAEPPPAALEAMARAMAQQDRAYTQLEQEDYQAMARVAYAALRKELMK